jgi:hypothetical protein
MEDVGVRNMACDTDHCVASFNSVKTFVFHKSQGIYVTS